jgi:hypothetical protein
MPREGLANETQRGYCVQNKNKSAFAMNTYPCVTGPDAWVTAPTNGGSLVFAATRVTDVSPKTAVPEGGLVNGGYVEKNLNEQKFFVLDPEAYTVGVSFTLHGATQIANYIGIQNISTRLLDRDGNEVKDAVYWVHKKTGELLLEKDIDVDDRGRFNVFKLKTLMDVAGVSDLDAPSSNSPKKSLRYTGVVLAMLISCSLDINGKVWRCDYNLAELQGTEKKLYIPSGLEAKSGSRSVQERRGVMLSVEVAGEIGFFSFSKLLTAWVTSLGMLGLVTAFVEFLMLNVMPHRREYAHLKFKTSEDFSDVRDGKVKVAPDPDGE